MKRGPHAVYYRVSTTPGEGVSRASGSEENRRATASIRFLARSLASTLVALALAGCVPMQPPAPVVEPRAPAVVEPPQPVVEPPAPAVVEPPAPAVQPPLVPPSAEAEEARQVIDLLGYTQRVAGLGPDEQKRELAAAKQSLNRERSGASRVRLALLYALPGTAFQDDARAIQLLEPVASGSGALRQLASLVHAQLAERLKTQKRADQLKEQVEQLRAIDKQLIERGQQSPPPRKP